MMIPGRTLHRIAARLCNTHTLQQIVEPAIADLQKEYRASPARGAVARGCVLLAGYSAVLKVIAICALRVSIPTAGERAAVVRTLVASLLLTLLLTAVLVLPPLVMVDRAAMSLAAFAYLMPQAVPLAIPIGLAFGIALGLAGGVSTRASAKAVLLAAVFASLASCATLVWAMPAANQAYRQAIARNLGKSGPLIEGYGEMSLSELRREAAVAAAAGDPRRAEQSAWFFHIRFALAAAAIAVSGFLLTISLRSVGVRMLIAVIACVGYWALLYAGEWLAVSQGTIGASTGAWLPNILFASAAVLMALWASDNRSVVEPSD